jgi:hypothetical protein
VNKVLDKPVQVGEKRTRYTMKIYDDSSEGVSEIRSRQIEFLRAFVDQPALLQLGPTFVQKMAIYHDGQRWVLAAEAEADNV